MMKLFVCGALISVISLAQDTVVMRKKLMDEAQAMNGFEFVSTQVISGKPMKGAPYSAQTVDEMVQVLADGNRITHSSTATLYRDSQGRERREQSFGSPDGSVTDISISDPVEGFTYILRPETKTAIKKFQPKIVADEVKKTVKLDIETIMKAEVPTVTMHSNGGSGGGLSQIVVDSGSFHFATSGKLPDAQVEDLGTQIIEGVSAQGTRRTTTIPAGQMGNERPIVMVNERWVSPDLGVIVMSTRSDPRTGTNTYKLTNINRSEPAPTLFQVPPGYTLTDLTSGHGTIKPDEQEQ